MSERISGPSVLALVSDMTGPSLWRVLWPISALEKAGYPCGWDLKDNHLIGAIAPSFDGYILPRMSWPTSHRRAAEAWFASIRRAGKFVVYECDDDLFTQHLTQRSIELDWTDGHSVAELDERRFQGIWAMQQCDGVTVSTQRLATIVRTYTDKPVAVVPNAIDLPWFQGVVRAGQRQTAGLTIGWAGGRRHDRDVAMMAKAWGRIAARYPEVTFVVQGYLPPVVLEHVDPARLRVIDWQPLESYAAGLREVDIGCCAVADTPFNRAKSNIKAIEYGAAGCAVVASPTLYAGLVDHGSSGFLAETADEWEDALEQVVTRPSLRSMMARRLYKTVERHHTLSRNLWRWPAAWQAIAEGARERRGSPQLA
jgi:glycosyltransferase involved in cell wall biosynthesis